MKDTTVLNRRTHISGSQKPPVSVLNKRRSERYALTKLVDVSQGQRRMAFGVLIDISKHGLGFRSRQALSLGAIYTISVRDLGTLQCRIVNHSDIDRYGVVFLESEQRKRRLDAEILRLIAAS